MLPLTSHQPFAGRRQPGFTLVELVVVLAVLVVIVGLLISQFGSLRFSAAGKDRTAEEVATFATLGEVRDAIMGASDHSGLWQDLGERPNLFPCKIADLFVTNYFSSYDYPPSLQRFDPVTRLGWRGPYLVPGGMQYSVNEAMGFADDYGHDGDPGVADAWGRPVVLQIPALDCPLDWHYARLVSAGPDGKIDTSLNVPSPDDTNRNDDVVLFLQITDTHGQP